MSETPRSVMLRRWLPLLALGLLLGALLLLGERLDRLPQASSAPSGSIWLRGARRRVVESLNSPSTLDGASVPTFSPAPGIYEKSVRVELLPADRRATVIFTTDGTLPTAEVGALYREPLLLDVQNPGVTVIRAVQVLDGGDGQRVVGPVATAVYVVGLNSQLPVLSLTLDPAALWSAESGILANPSFRGDDWERPGDVTWFEPGGAGSFALTAGLRVHGDVPLSAPKQSLRLYFRAEYGAACLEYPLFPGHPDQPEVEQSYKRLLLQAGDRNGWWTLFRDQLVAETAAALGLPVAQGRFVHLFINGRSWGLYRLSERVDRFFLEDNFGYQSVDVVQEGRPQEGDDAAWDALVDWAAANDLEDPQAFAYVVSRLDIANVTDFAVLKLFFDFSPEDLFAVRNRGGAWHFVYGGGGQHFAQRPAELPLLLGLTDDSDFTVLFRALMDNAEFRSAFAARTGDLLNTVLAPQAVAGRAGNMAELLASDIPYEEARWATPSQGASSQGAQAVWAEHVTALQTFLAARPDALRELLVERLGRGAPAQVQITVEPPAGGEVFVGGLPLPGAGAFFTGAELHFVAVPHAGYTFVGWEGAPEAATGTSPVLNMQVTGSQALTARFRSISEDEPGLYPDDVIINEVWINDNGTHYASLDGRPITGDWVELLVRRPASVDLRGWRLTDNDTKTGSAEGSLIFPQLDALAAVPRGTVILIIVTENSANAANFPADDLDGSDGRMVFYVGLQPGNGTLDATTDPGFALGTNNDNLVLLAPALGAVAPSGVPGAEIGIDFVAEGAAVTPYSFGVLADGVRFETPFRYLGGDDGAVFQALTSNDSSSAWLLDPSACESGDALCLDAANQLTPGALNPGQRSFPWWILALLILVTGLLVGLLLRLESRRRVRR